MSGDNCHEELSRNNAVVRARSLAVYMQLSPTTTIRSRVVPGPAINIANGSASDDTLKLSLVMLNTDNRTLAP